MCRVWNTTALLCACHQDIEAGREEEEYIQELLSFFGPIIKHSGTYVWDVHCYLGDPKDGLVGNVVARHADPPPC